MEKNVKSLPVVKKVQEGWDMAEKAVKQLVAKSAGPWQRFQSSVIENAGVASRAQVEQVARDVSKLSKKVDALLNGKAAHRAD